MIEPILPLETLWQASLRGQGNTEKPSKLLCFFLVGKKSVMSPVFCDIFVLFCAYLHGVVARHGSHGCGVFKTFLQKFIGYLCVFWLYLRTLSVEAGFRGRNKYQFFALTEGFLWLATPTSVFVISGVPTDYHSVRPLVL